MQLPDKQKILKENADRLVAEFFKSWRPPPRLTLSEWADEHAVLSAESSAETGRWMTLPYQKGIMDAITDPDVEKVSVIKSARVGYTKIVNHACGYYISQDPCGILIVQPTVEDAEGYSKEELAPMIRDTPILQNLVSESKAKDGSNTILSKSYPGGVLSLVGANSARGFRRISRRVVMFDEVDAYPPTTPEGDQIKLGTKRSEYYWNRKIVAGSTPTNKDFSRIEKLYAQSDQRRRFVPCPHCGHMQYLKWGGRDKRHGIKWPEGEPHKAYYLCESDNQCHIEHKWKRWMDERGEWIPTITGKDGLAVPAPEMRSRHAGFHIWAAYSYSPNATWGHLAEEFLECKDDPDMLKTFVNTALGECWDDSYSAQVGAEGLQGRVELYEKNVIPLGALVAGASVDVQDNRLAVKIMGWGRGEEGWIVSHEEIMGDPSQPEVWKQLDRVVFQDYRHECGKMVKLAFCTIDTGGHFTQESYQWARDRKRKTRHTFILPIKGSSKAAQPPIGKAKKQDINYRGQILPDAIEVYPVGTDTIKDTLMRRLQLLTGVGILHFHSELPLDYFEQITSEKKIAKRNSSGQTVRVWVKKKPSARNEALDCLVYNYAGLHYLYTRYNRKTFWDQLEKKLGIQVTQETAELLNLPPDQMTPQEQPVTPAPAAAPAADSGMFDSIEEDPFKQEQPAPLQKRRPTRNMVFNRRRGGFVTNW